MVTNQSIEEAHREAANVTGLLGLDDLTPLARAYVDLLEVSLDGATGS